MSNNYTSGCVSRHLVGVGGSIMLSLLSVYGIGLVDVYFLSYLNNEVVLAAVGTAGVIFLPLFAMSTKLVLLKTLALTVPFAYTANKFGDQNTVLVAEFLSIAVASSISLVYVFKFIKHISEQNTKVSLPRQ